MRVQSKLSIPSEQELALTRELSEHNAPHPGQIPASITQRAQVFSLEELKENVRWIRDVLEPHIAREGHRFLEADTTLELQEFLSRLRAGHVSLDRIRESRIHKAVLRINGRGTRWPSKLIDIADDIIERWKQSFGPISEIRTLLYEPGGRLHGICEPHELQRTGIVERWQANPSSRVSCLNAWVHGNLGFKPGHWWLHPLFAFYDGIIDSPSPWGGISADEESAYAIVLTHYAELEKVPDPAGDYCPDSSYDHFWYRSKSNDPGRFRLKNAILPPKQPIRVLRSHTLHSEHRPHVGLRYEGLYMVTGFRVKETGGVTIIDLKLKRQTEQMAMKRLMKRPTADEVDDYLEYRRIREEQVGQVHSFETLASKTARMMHVNDSLDDEPFEQLSSLNSEPVWPGASDDLAYQPLMQLSGARTLAPPGEEDVVADKILTPTSSISVGIPPITARIDAMVAAAFAGLVPSKRLKEPYLEEKRRKSMDWYDEHKVYLDRLDRSASWAEAQGYESMTRGVADLRELDSQRLL